MNEEDLDADPVVAAIRARMERMLADTSFKPGPPKKKAHKVLALAPTIRTLRAQGRTWPAVAEACKAEGLVVTPKTVREVMRDLDGPNSPSETIDVMQTAPKKLKTTKASTSRRKSHNTPMRKSAGKSQRTPRERPDAATMEDRAHMNGRAHETNENLYEELGVAPHRNVHENGRAPKNSRGHVAGGGASTPALTTPPASNVDAPPPAATNAAPKRRFGAKGIER